VKIASWNVNSLRAREDQVLDWLEGERPDVLCMQEIKMVDQEFPTDAFGDLGYDVAFFGQRAYNGVAIASRDDLQDVTRGFPGEGPDAERRLIAATIGGELTSNAAVRCLSFTGSTAVGKRLMEQCAQTVKRVCLELGGNAPFLVFDDADLDAAVEGAIASKFRNAGQTCVCANRVLVQDGIHDRFVAALAERVRALAVGPGTEPGVAIGPLINDAALAKVERHVADARRLGAQVVLGGRPHALGRTFYEPTILTGVTLDMAMTNEETFGPVAGITRFRDEAEAIRIANDTPFGLAAYLYARDAARIWRVAEALESGMVGINTGLLSTAEVPFGGVKESGLGREGAHHGIEEWIEWKYLCWGGIA